MRKIGVNLSEIALREGAGWALVQAGYRLGDIAAVREGRATIQSAWDIVRAQGVTAHDAYFADRLAAVDGVLASAALP